MHRDFAPEQAAGWHWEVGDELRETSPVYFNTFAQGYWVFTRHDAVRDIYKTPELFSSESITPWQPDPIYRFVPTQIDAPDHIKYRRIVNPWFSPRAMEAAEPAMRALCRQLVEDVAPTGTCDFVTEFALRFPTEAFLSVAGIDPADADLFVPWVEDFFGGFSGFGCVLTTDDDLAGVDLDKCVDPATGAIEPWALTIIRRLNKGALQ